MKLEGILSGGRLEISVSKGRRKEYGLFLRDNLWMEHMHSGRKHCLLCASVL